MNHSINQTDRWRSFNQNSNMGEKNNKTVLFFGINTPGHQNTLLAIADKLKADHGYRTVFLVLGPPMDNTIEKHGHETVMMEEKGGLEVYAQNNGNETIYKTVNGDTNGVCGKMKLTGYLKVEYLLRTQSGSLSLDPMARFSKVMNILKTTRLNELVENHENLTNSINQVQPDLIIVDLFMVPPSILRLKNVPWVKLCSASPFGLLRPTQANGIRPPSFVGAKLYDRERRDKLRKENPTEWDAMIESWRPNTDSMTKLRKDQTSIQLNNFYKLQGCLPPTDAIWGHESPYLNLYLFPKEIDYDQDDDLFMYPPRWFRCDSMTRKSVTQTDSTSSKFWADKLSVGMKGKTAMIYFSLGSLASGNHDIMQKYVDIFRKDRDRLYVISKGPHGNKYELDPNNMIGDNYIPQPFFLERANLAIIHGGNNSIFESLYFGVPMIVLPAFGDQYDNAQRIEDLNLGKRLPVHECDGEKLSNTIVEILSNAALIKRVRSIGEKIRARDTSTKISRMLKKLIDEKNLDQSFIDLCREKNVEEIQF